MESTTLIDLAKFGSATAVAAQNATTCVLPRGRGCLDSEYKRFRAVRRRAEKRVRKTEVPDDWHTAHRLQNHVRRQLENIGQQRWRRLCARLDPRQS